MVEQDPAAGPVALLLDLSDPHVGLQGLRPSLPEDPPLGAGNKAPMRT